MSDRDWATIIGFLVFVGLRLLDYLLPKGRHMRFVNKFTVEDDDDDTKEVKK